MTNELATGHCPRERGGAFRWLVLGLAAFAVYAGALGHDLVWDDHGIRALVEERFRQGGLPSVLTSEFVMDPSWHTGYYRPLVLLSFWLDGRLEPIIPVSFHLTNILLHVACSLLVLRLLLDLGLPRGGSLVGALVFAWHPVHVESVAFVSGRTDLWAALFSLLAAVLWLRCRTSPDAIASPAGLGSLVAFLAAVLSKEIAFPLPLVLLTWDALAVRDADSTRPSWWYRNRAWLAGWAAIVAVSLLVRWGLAGVPFGGSPADAAHAPLVQPAPGLIDVPARALKYFRLLLVPWPLRAYYTRSGLSIGTLDLVAAIALLVAFLWEGRAVRRRTGLVALAWSAVFLGPVMGMVQVGGGVLSERFAYLPSIGLSILTASLLSRELAVRRVTGIATAVALTLFVAGTTTRARVWSDELTLFTDIVRTVPDYAEGHNNLGLVHSARGESEKAIASFQEALRLVPNFPQALNNLGVEYRQAGRTGEAIASFEAAWRHYPGFVEALVNLGEALLASGRAADAERVLRLALRSSPDSPEALNNLGLALMALGRPGEAAGAHSRAIAGRADDPRAHAALGNALMQAARLEEAAEAYGRALALEPRLAPARYGRALALWRLGRTDAAMRDWHLLRSLDPARARELELAMQGAR